MSPDGKLRMHVLEPFGDIQAKVIDVSFNSKDHGSTDLQWIAQLFNISMHFGATRLIVTLDGYKNKNLDPLDQVLSYIFTHVKLFLYVNLIFIYR